MPASTKKQQRTAGMDLARVRAGKRPRVMKTMTEAQLRDFARRPVKPKAPKKSGPKAKRKG